MRLFRWATGPLQRLHQWAKIMLSDDLPHEEKILPASFYDPPTVYRDEEITPALIANNHLAHIDAKLMDIGHGLERIWDEVGMLKGVVGVLKRIVVGAAISGCTYLLIDRVVPALGG